MKKLKKKEKLTISSLVKRIGKEEVIRWLDAYEKHNQKVETQGGDYYK